MKTQSLKSFFFCCLLSDFCILANAQIVYTNVIPDKTCNTNGCAYNLDLNNDGITDFAIDLTINQIGFPTYAVRINPLSGNAVAITYDPSELDSGNLINSTLIYSAIPNQALYYKYWHCTKPPLGQYHCYPVFSGNWGGATNKYLGLRIKIGNDYYYGWARLNINIALNGTSPSFTIKDYAYNTIPNQSILAGDTDEIATGIQEIENQFHLSVSPNPFQHATLISFSLSQTEKVSVEIYDVEGKLIRTLADQIFPQGKNLLQWNATYEKGNAVSAGVYFLKIQSSDFSQTQKLMVMK